MPLDRLLAQKLGQGHIEALDRQSPIHQQGRELLDESMNIRVLGDEVPVEPGDFVVLTEGVVVAALGAPHLVAHQQHRGSGRQ